MIKASSQCISLYLKKKLLNSMVRDMSDEKKIDLEKMVVDMAVEDWRFSKLFLRMANKLDAGDATKYVNQLRYFLKKIEDNLSEIGLKIVNLEGHPFEAGMAISVLNIDDFEPQDSLIIDQMIEPIIMSNDGVKRSGTVTVRKASL
jgi:hypothetical protein